MRMKLGGFGRIADYDNIRKAGFDYAELDVPEIEALSEVEFHILCDKVHGTGFPVRTGARALPVSEPWFFTSHFCPAEYRDYLEHACQRAKILGMDRMILGNGRARMLIDGASIEKEHRFIGFMRMFAEIAGNYDVEVILEPLGPAYSNYINTLPEAVRMIHEVDMPNLFTMADLRHMYGAGEPFEDIVTYGKYVRHIHADCPITYPERYFPGIEDGFDYTEFLGAVKESGYQDTITIEADIPEDWKRAYRDAAEVLENIL